MTEIENNQTNQNNQTNSINRKNQTDENDWLYLPSIHPPTSFTVQNNKFCRMVANHHRNIEWSEFSNRIVVSCGEIARFKINMANLGYRCELLHRENPVSLSESRFHGKFWKYGQPPRANHQSGRLQITKLPPRGEPQLTSDTLTLRHTIEETSLEGNSISYILKWGTFESEPPTDTQIGFWMRILWLHPMVLTILFGCNEKGLEGTSKWGRIG
jgi:hypothetical protein